MLDLSIIISVYNEDESLTELISWIEQSLAGKHIVYEVLLIDDGSTDRSWNIIQNLSERYPSIIRGISFRRNYGKSAALFCGFEAARGEVVITMDATFRTARMRYRPCLI